MVLNSSLHFIEEKRAVAIGNSALWLVIGQSKQEIIRFILDGRKTKAI